MKNFFFFLTIILFLIFFPWRNPFTHASTDFIDNFDSYSTGSINGQDSWYGDGDTLIPQVNTDRSESSPNSLSLDSVGSYGYARKTRDTGFTAGIFSFLLNGNEFISGAVTFQLLYSNNSTAVFLELSTYGFKYFDTGGSHNICMLSACPVLDDNWHRINITYDATPGTWYLNIDDLPTYGPYPYYSENHTSVIKFNVTQQSLVGSTVYIDNLLESIQPPPGPTPCNTYETSTACEQASCCWYIPPSYMALDPSCGDCNASFCEDTYYGCPNCNTQELCEEQETCFWTPGPYAHNIGICQYGTGECNVGSECHFCSDETTCEAQSCFWYDNVCHEFDSDFSYASEPENPDFGWLVNNIVSALKWLFIPDGQVISDLFHAILRDISGRFPFGYFTHIADLMKAQTISEGSLPELNLTIAGHTLTYLSFASASQTGIFTTGKPLIKVVIYVSFALYIYIRVRDSDVGV